MTTAPAREVNRAREAFYRGLTAVPHRAYELLLPHFSTISTDDADFAGRLFVYLMQGGTQIRDQADVAAIALIQNQPVYADWREAARCLMLGSDVYDAGDWLDGLEPFRLFRIFRFISKSERKATRFMGGLAADWMAMLEANPSRWDGVYVGNRSDMKWLYAHYHLKPSKRAEGIFSGKDIPEDSQIAALKVIAKEKDPAKQARLVLQHKIPYRIAASIMPKVTPEVGVALVGAMSPTEALNSRAWMEKSGLLAIPEVKKVYLEKVKSASGSVARADHRKSAQGSDAAVSEAVAQAKQKSVEKGQRVESNVAILIDRSGSMNTAIEVAARFGARIAPVTDGELLVVAHNDYASEMTLPRNRGNLAEWESAFSRLNAHGGTVHRAALEMVVQKRFPLQKLVLITDGADHGEGFTALLKRSYGDELPHVVMIHLQGERNTLGPELKAMGGLRYDEFEFGGDYNEFDQVVALLTGAPAKSIIESVMEMVLPRRVRKGVRGVDFDVKDAAPEKPAKAKAKAKTAKKAKVKSK